jgi:hypothetical protein
MVTSRLSRLAKAAQRRPKSSRELSEQPQNEKRAAAKRSLKDAARLCQVVTPHGQGQVEIRRNFVEAKGWGEKEGPQGLQKGPEIG